MLLDSPHRGPLAVLHSGGACGRWSRWTMLARPRGVLRHWRDGARWQRFGHTSETEIVPGAGAFESLSWLDTMLETESKRRAGHAGPADVPWRGGWIGYVSYELGQVIESRASSGRRRAARGEWPLYEWLWCPDVFVFDGATSQWYQADLQSATPVCESEVLAAFDVPPGACDQPHRRPCIEAWRPAQQRGDVEAAVQRVIDYIRAGDVFQANLAQKFTSRLLVPPRHLAAAAWDRAPNWYSAYLELAPDRQILSLSPELFIEFDARTRQIVTRPLKGTLPGRREATTLHTSEKDEAELNMIIDLMRNDLGRLCEFGSVRVTQPRAIESHPTVHHGVATIEGRVREENASLQQILTATFPPGSITGAPKIRAMQIIDELEPFERGPYCGSIGYVGFDQITLNVAIRTMCINRDRITYGAGAGIVADSEPQREYDEMLTKCAVVERLAMSHEPGEVEGSEVLLRG